MPPIPTQDAPPSRLPAGVLLTAMPTYSAPQTCTRTSCQLAAPLQPNLLPETDSLRARPRSATRFKPVGVNSKSTDRRQEVTLYNMSMPGKDAAVADLWKLLFF